MTAVELDRRLRRPWPPLIGRLLIAGVAVTVALLLTQPMSAEPLADAALPHQAMYVAQTLPPSSLLSGQSYRVSVTMMNTGSETWTAAEGYRLGSQNPYDNSTWGLHRVELPYSVAPNQLVTFNFSITAPTSPGSYDFQWRMVHESVTWFGDLTPAVRLDAQDLAPQDFDPGYDVGPNYHSVNADFLNGAFISRYQDAAVRATVIGQLQAMADAGASVIQTLLWVIGSPPDVPYEAWQLSFPLSAQELSNIQRYAQDVAATKRPDGTYLGLQLTMQWFGCADYRRGSPDTSIGDCSYSWTAFAADVRTSISSLVQRVAGVRDPDGTSVVRRLYLESEVMIGAKPNQDRFLREFYPYFLDATAAAGLDGSIYFLIVPAEADILDDFYVDAQYSILNGHKSLYWFYRSVAFLVSQALPLPSRLDFAFYPVRQGAPYSQLVDRVMDDFQFVFSGHKGAVVETYYFQDADRRAELGQAFGLAYLARGVPEQVLFWTTPYGGVTPDVGAPFDIGAFRLRVPAGTLSNIAASSSPCIVQPGENGCSASITWSTTAPSATAAVWVHSSTGEATLFACGKSGQATTPRIPLGGMYTFSLYATPACGGQTAEVTGLRLASTVMSAAQAEPVTGSIDASPNPCHAGGAATCSTTVSWHAAVNSGTARVFVTPAGGAPQLFACGIDGQQQAPWIQRKLPFTFTLDAASTCNGSPLNAPLASVTVTAPD